MGKTYAMLQDAQRARAGGADIVAGYVEPHARPETQALLAGLEVVPPRRVPQAGTTFLEMDVLAVLRRRAAVVLVDELAHSNLPGSVHTKRYEDVRVILAAGSDVWTTLNVQHLASLGDQLASVTHVRQRETIPDAFLSGQADEIVFVDLPPEELRARIREGRVYPPARVDAALEGFFRQDRLAALREIAMREAAQLVETRRVASTGGVESPLSADVRGLADHLVILAAGRTGDERVVRRGWRLARSLQCAADVLHIHPDPGPGAPPESLALLCATLDLPLHLAPAAGGRHGIGAAVADFARRRRATHLMAGAARDRRLPWRGSTLQEIMDRLPWVDFIVIGDPARRLGGEADPP